MDLNSRPQAPEPYELLPKLPTFTLTLDDCTDGAPMPTWMTAAAGSTSPALHWSGFPTETESFLVTCFDPDAPTPSGYWHWAITDIPANTTTLAKGVGASDLELEGSAFHLRNDAGSYDFFGAAPPAGDRPHRYIFAVYALDTPTLELSDTDSIATANFKGLFHALARATFTVTHQIKE